MAYVKTKALYDASGQQRLLEYTTNKEKTMVSISKDDEELEEGTIDKVLAYTKNTEKTSFQLDEDEDILVSGHNCIPENAPVKFNECKLLYNRRLSQLGIDPASRIQGQKLGKDGMLVDKEAREAYHLIMSFSENPNATPYLVHQIGKEFCEKALPEHMAVVSTHLNTMHFHNHIVFSAYQMDAPYKYRDTKEQLQKLRDISDELSLKYGLDIIVGNDLGIKQGISYTENLERKNGNSWKKRMQEDLSQCLEISSSWKEYCTNVAACGYGIKETTGTVTYFYLNNPEKKVRGKTLGENYTKAFILDMYGEKTDEAGNTAPKPLKSEYGSNRGDYGGNNNSYQRAAYTFNQSLVAPGKKVESFRQHKRKLNLYVSRYTDTGRRRGDLEVLFLCALRLINYFMDRFADTDENRARFRSNPIYQPYKIKQKTMNESLMYVVKYGIKTEEEIKTRKREIGQRIKSLETDLRSIDDVITKLSVINDDYKTYTLLEQAIKNRGLNIDLRLGELTDDEKRKSLAILNPLTARERRELFKLLDGSQYRVNCKYDDISSDEFKQIKDFINGNSKKMPESVLVTKEDYEKHKREAYYEKMRQQNDDKLREKLSGQVISEAQEKIIAGLINSKGLTNKPKDKYEASVIISYYYNTNPFAVTHKQDETSEPIKEWQKNNIEELLALKNEKICVPVSELSVKDYYTLFNYLVNKGVTPAILGGKKNKSEIIKENNKKDLYFTKEVSFLSPNDQEVLFKYRALSQNLQGIGLTSESASEVAAHVKKLKEEAIEISNSLVDAKMEYKNLSRLEYNTNLAKNKKYTNGAKYKDLSEEETPEVSEEVEVIDNKPEIMPQKTDEELLKEEARLIKDTIEPFTVEDEYFTIT